MSLFDAIVYAKTEKEELRIAREIAERAYQDESSKSSTPAKTAKSTSVKSVTGAKSTVGSTLKGSTLKEEPTNRSKTNSSARRRKHRRSRKKRTSSTDSDDGDQGAKGTSTRRGGTHASARSGTRSNSLSLHSLEAVLPVDDDDRSQVSCESLDTRRNQVFERERDALGDCADQWLEAVDAHYDGLRDELEAERDAERGEIHDEHDQLMRDLLEDVEDGHYDSSDDAEAAPYSEDVHECWHDYPDDAEAGPYDGDEGDVWE